jgi:hypothetical protein
MMLMSPVVCTATPQNKRIKVNQVKAAVQHAKDLCKNYEDTVECKVAWDQATELDRALKKQSERERHAATELIWFSDLETREYDL